MNKTLRQIIIFTCILCVGLVTIAPLQIAQANSYLTHVRVEVIGVDHDDGTTTHHVVRVQESYGTHHSIGSHRHPSPIVDVVIEYENCTETNCSKCS